MTVWRHRQFRRSSGAQGFTLVEALVSLAILAIMLVAILNLFDFTNRLSRVQMQLADMQQEQRIAQAELVKFIRLAGRGLLPMEVPPTFTPAPRQGLTFPTGAAISLRVNNAPASTRVGDSTSPLVLPGTDVLTLRGAITNPIYYVNYSDPNSVQLFDAAGLTTSDPTLAKTVKIQVCSISPIGANQDLSALTDAIAKSYQEAILIVSPQADASYGVVALDPANSLTTSVSCPGAPNGGITLSLRVGSKANGVAREDIYADLSPAPQGGRLVSGLKNVAFLSIVEEYRYYIRQEYVNPSDNTSALAPRLSRARFYPNTDLPWAGSTANLSLDVAENITDLQVALGIDENLNDQVIDDPASECGNDWIGDGVGTETSDALIARVPGVCKWDGRPLYYVRISTLARTDRFDPAYVGPLVGQIENHVYTVSSDENSNDNRHRRKRISQTIVKPRNVY